MYIYIFFQCFVTYQAKSRESHMESSDRVLNEDEARVSDAPNSNSNITTPITTANISTPTGMATTWHVMV